MKIAAAHHQTQKCKYRRTKYERQDWFVKAQRGEGKKKPPTNRRPETWDLTCKQMRPGPATRAALLCNMFWPCSTQRGMGERRIRHRSPKRTTDTCIQQIATREANFANQSAALRWPTASPAVCGGLCEEAATPGHQRAPKRILEEPSW